MTRWNVNFNGDPSTLAKFLEKVEELQIPRGVLKHQLLLLALHLYKTKALIWYRSVRNSVKVGKIWLIREIGGEFSAFRL